nr:unnamed protein product [Callosobruchus chinensis]
MNFLNTTHRYFVQYMLKHGSTTVDNALKFTAKISDGTIQDVDVLRTFVTQINGVISKQSFKIIFTTCEVTEQNIILWLNTKHDNISHLQNVFTPAHLEYFHAILMQIINSQEFRITYPECLNLTCSLKYTLSRDAGQLVFEKWIKGGYYVKQINYIYLGPRLIQEFSAYLKTCCANSLCILCQELVFCGKQCASCGKTLHSHCLTKYFQNVGKCPACHNDWREGNRTLNQLASDSDD